MKDEGRMMKEDRHPKLKTKLKNKPRTPSGHQPVPRRSAFILHPSTFILPQ
jgi:hypothetical protein